MRGEENRAGYRSMNENSGVRVDGHGGNRNSASSTVGYSAGLQGNAANFVPATSAFLTVGDNEEISTGDVDFTLVANVDACARVLPLRWVSRRWRAGIPAAIRHLFTQQPVYQSVHVHPKLRTHSYHATNDAGFHFAGKERLVPPVDIFVFWQLVLTDIHEPFDVLLDSVNSASGLLTGRVKPHVVQQQ